MPWNIFGRELHKVGIVGSGQIGPDIALHFTKVLMPKGVRVVVNDISEDALKAGREKLEKKVARGVKSGAFKPDQAEAMTSNITWTTDKEGLAGAGLVVEAATEDLGIKRKIFADIARHVPDGTILASNSSHLEPEVIFEGIKAPERTLVIHYFFPAERNMVVEVVPGAETDAVTTDWCMRFYEAIGKAPIQVGSRYGYALDPIFEGLFLAALKLADSGAADHKQVNEIARKCLRQGIGPFTAMNLTGGTPLTRVGLGNYNSKIMEWFEVPDSMKDRTDPWPAGKRDEKIEYPQETFDKVSRRMLGAYFGLVGEILESGITNVGDLEMAAGMALDVAPPFRMMNKIGVTEALKMVEEYAAENPGFRVAECLKRSEPWVIPHVHRKDREDVAVVTIRRPQKLNALNLDIFEEIGRVFDVIRNDKKIRGVVLTGFGVKAFVSGADIGMIADIESAEIGEKVSWSSNEVLLKIETLGKPVVCAMNGLALGGGSELAMACTTRIARRGLPICFGQPEVKLGIIPGAGATQRLPRLIGLEKAWNFLRTGTSASTDEAERLGYIREQVEDDLLSRAVSLARKLGDGSMTWPSYSRAGVKIPKTLPDVDIKKLSRRVDEIIRKAILEGCAMPLEEGLRFESKCFGEVCGTEDKKIGIANFLKTQLKEETVFVHR